MKHPLWMINSFLLIFLVIVILFISFTRQQVPYRESIESTAPAPLSYTSSTINIEKIWESDLFDTYQKPAEEIEEMPQLQQPPPPQPQPVMIPEVPTPQFLDPLDITLKGIMIVTNNDAQNRAIISDNKTQREAVYKVGDQIEDAQLVKIMSNKVIFIRSNGQQEVLYLREKDARQDPTYAVIGNWSEVVQKISENKFMISSRAFINRVTSLAQFIDMLDLTTVYKQGTSIGCRIGTIAENSLGSALGLHTDDIVVSVNGISAGNTANRFGIYKTISNLHEDDTITVDLLRDNQEMTYTYVLHDFPTVQPTAQPEPGKKGAPVATAPTAAVSELKPTVREEEQLKILQGQHKLAPSIKEIRAQERKNMLNFNKMNNKRSAYKLTGTTP